MKIGKSIIALALAALVPATAFADTYGQVSFHDPQALERQTYLRSLRERMDSGKELTGEECAEIISCNAFANMTNRHPRADHIYAFTLLNDLFPTIAKLHEAGKLLPPDVPPESAKLVNDQLFERFNAQAKNLVQGLAGGHNTRGMFAGTYLDWMAGKLSTLDTPEAVKAAVGNSNPAWLKAKLEETRQTLANYYIDKNAPSQQTVYETLLPPIDAKAAMPPLGKLAPQTLALLDLPPPSDPPMFYQIANVLSGQPNQIRGNAETYTDAANRAKIEAILKKLGEVLKLVPEMPEAVAQPAPALSPKRRSSQLSYRSADKDFLEAILKELEDLRAENKAHAEALRNAIISK